MSKGPGQNNLATTRNDASRWAAWLGASVALLRGASRALPNGRLVPLAWQDYSGQDPKPGGPRRLALVPALLAVAVAAGSCNPHERLRCTNAPPISPGEVVINEAFFRFSTAADATPEQRVNFVELAGPPGTDLSCLDLVGVNGNDCSLYNPISLAGQTIPQSGIFLIAEAKREWTLTRHTDCPAGQARYTDPDTGERVCGPDPCDPNPCTEPNRGVCSRSMPDEPTYRCGCDHGYYLNEEGRCLENPIYARADLVHQNANYRTGPDALVLLDLTGTGTTIDAVTYSGPIGCPAVPRGSEQGGPTRPPQTRESIARCTGSGDEYDQFVNTRNNALDWNSADPTPGEPNSSVICPQPCAEPPLPGEVIFSEISPRPHGPQWVELFNISDSSASLCNCWLADTRHDDGVLSLGSLSTLEWGPAVAPNGHTLLAKSAFPDTCPNVPVDFFYGAGANFRVTTPDAAILLCAPMPGQPMPPNATIWQGEFTGDLTGTVNEVYEVARVEFLAEDLERGYSLAKYSDGNWGRTWDGPFCTTEEWADHGSPRLPNSDPPPSPLPGELELTEIAPRPIVSPEWLEFVSKASHPVGLDQCFIVDGGVTPHQFSLNYAGALEPNQRYLFVHSSNDPCGLPADFIYSSVRFAVTTPEEAAIVCLPGPGGMPPGAQTWELADGQIAYVVDMVEFDASDLPRGYSLARFSDGNWGRTWDGPYCTVPGEGTEYGSPGQPNANPPACPCPADIVMTEMMFDPDGGGSEWFELYNAGNETISLHCYSVISQRWESDEQRYEERDRWAAASLEEPPSLAPGQYIVVDKGDCEAFGLESCVPLEGGFTMYSTMEGAFDTVCEDSSGAERLVDRVAYNRSVHPRRKGYSLQLDNRHTSSPEREYWYRWCRSEPVYETLTTDDGQVSNHGTPGAANHTCPDVPNWPAEGELVITELMGRSRSHNNRWFELHNPGQRTMSLDGCTITRVSETGTASHTTLPVGGGALVSPHAWQVFARPTMPCPNNTSCIQWPSTSLTLTEVGTLSIECPRLDDPAGTLKAVVDNLVYDYADFGTSTNYRALVLRPDRLTSPQYPAAWYLATDDQAYEAVDADGQPSGELFEYGTPGSANPMP